jgi:hypothetical protein
MNEGNNYMRLFDIIILYKMKIKSNQIENNINLI